MNKYGNKKTVLYGIIFDSKKESRRYQELLMLEKAGEIDKLELQPSFTLLAPLPKIHRGIKYFADFKYYDKKLLQTVIEDVKPSARFSTAVYKIKKKLLISKYPHYVFKETY